MAGTHWKTRARPRLLWARKRPTAQTPAMAARGKPVRVPTSLKAQATVRPTSADSGFQALRSPRGGLLTATDSNADRLTL